MNKEKQLKYISKQRKEHSGPMDEYRAGYFKCLDDLESKIQSEPEETDKYTEWLENMVILLAEYYKESHDTLYRKLVNRESDLYLEIPTIQDTDIINAVRDISKLIPKGTITVDKLQEFVKKLESR